MATSRIHPQFFHTLVHGFHTHFTIPESFFSKYVEGRSVAELKSDVSDRTWEVKMSGRRFTDGWKDFVVANDFRIGDVVVVRYVGDSVFHFSDLGPNCSEIQRNEGKNLLKRRLHEVEFSSNNGDVVDDEELPREKRAKTNSEEAEAVSSSSSADNSCFVAFVTGLNLTTDTLYLPLRFTSSNSLKRNCRKIVLRDGKERSWALGLEFNESSDTFYIRGWRNFCDENGQKAGGFFMFELVGNGETPVLSFSTTESVSDRRQRDCSEASKIESVVTKLSSEVENIAREGSKDECSSLNSLMGIEKKEYILKPRGSPYSSYSPCHKRFIKFTLPPDYVRIRNLSLAAPFVRDNGITKPGEICLLDKDGRRWLTNLGVDKKGTTSLGKGWKDFVKANGLESGFTLKLIWEETIPVLSLCCAESNCDRELEEFLKAIEKKSCLIDTRNIDKISNDENNEESRSQEKKKNHLKWRDSTPSSDKQFLTLTITPASFERNRLRLSKNFTRENGINKPGIITLLGKDGIKYQTVLSLDKTKGTMLLRTGWKDFVKNNGLKTGDSFTLELIWEDQTPVLSLCPSERSIGREAGEGCSETNQKKSLPIEPSTCKKISKDKNIKDESSKEKNNKEERRSVNRERNHRRVRNLTPSSQKQFVTLTITPSSVERNRLVLTAQFVRENNINKPGTICLLDTDGTKWLTKLQLDKKGTMSLGQGWQEFTEANNFKLGESFTMKLTWEDTTPILSLLRTDFSYSNSNKEESIFSKPKSRDSSPAIEKRLVTLALTPEDVKASKLILPSQFMKANGINKLGKITLWCENGMEWSAYLLTRDGTVALGCGWKGFCEANGVQLGEPFTLKFIDKRDTTPVLKFSSPETKHKTFI
ncbi:B3 domain-containing protein REM13 [Capsella rubella]|uniref:B3 domain-containing protein REM13 n=1 Tax=Capsella rubella TaxID=81985 RepID=UPI000CD4EE31|nr:B3 domain-containing protein REM13 [Capsella rubella]